MDEPASAPPVKLRLEGVSVRHAGRPGPALEGVDLEVFAGEALAVVGPSGAGKSTLLRVMNDLEAASAGRVLLDGVALGDLPAHVVRRRVGFVAQVPVSLGATVADELAFGPRLAGDRRLDAAPAQAEVLARVGLGADFLPRAMGRLSVGEQQRVSLARALANGPEVLLLDEPTSALDAGTAAALLGLLGKLRGAERALTLVVVTHALEQARAFADRVALVAAGRVVEVAPTSRFFGPDASASTRTFLESGRAPGA